MYLCSSRVTSRSCSTPESALGRIITWSLASWFIFPFLSVMEMLPDTSVSMLLRSMAAASSNLSAAVYITRMRVAMRRSISLGTIFSLSRYFTSFITSAGEKPSF